MKRKVTERNRDGSDKRYLIFTHRSDIDGMGRSYIIKASFKKCRLCTM